MLAVGIASTLILLGMTTFYAKHEESTILEQNKRTRSELLQTTIYGLRALMLKGSADVAQNYASLLQQVPGLIEVKIMRRDGMEAFLDNQTIEDVNWRKGKTFFLPKETETSVQVLAKDDKYLQQALSMDAIVSYPSRSETGESLMNLLAPIGMSKSCHGCHGDEHESIGVVKLTTSMTPVYAAIEEARWRALRIAGIALALLLLLVWQLTQRMVVKKIQLVTEAMSKVADGDYTTEVNASGNDELRTMSESFNTMVKQLLKTYDGFQQEKNKLATIILSAREGMIATDENERVVLVNPAAERLLGKTAQQISEEGFLHFLDDPDYIRAFIDNNGHGIPDVVVFNNRVIQINAARICNQKGKVIGSAALIRDITEEKKLEEELRQISYTDKLTGLFNRRRMDELLREEFSRARRYGHPLTILLFDVDHFKKFNDTHGHDMGDRVLETIGHILKDQFRKNDFPCRYGGEEFCVILTSTPAPQSQDGCFIPAERLRARIEATPVQGLRVTISIGVAVFPHPQLKTPEEMIKMADQALYEAKHQGRNRVILAYNLPQFQETSPDALPQERS
ncbi:MAG: diguanylate cyclase [Magnetococcales bacterium]|nr:diguanylate cyclase [Magnetococcales bacterium]